MSAARVSARYGKNARITAVQLGKAQKAKGIADQTVHSRGIEGGS